jgi:hypothetical protein
MAFLCDQHGPHATPSARPIRALLPLACGVALGYAVAASVGACAAPPASQADDRSYAELRELVGPGAEFLTTKHFVVVYDTPIETVRQLTARLEATYAGVEKFCTFNRIAFEPSGTRLEILLFDRPESFHRYAAGLGLAPQQLNGFYHAGTHRSAFFNILNHPDLEALRREIARLEERVAQLNARELTRAERAQRDAVLKQLHFYRNRRNHLVEKLNRTVVQHEVVHHLLFDARIHVRGGQNPVWLVEGLACLFEPPPSEKGAGLGVTNQMRLADFRAACDEVLDAPDARPRKMKPEDLQQAYASGRFVPLRRLISLRELAEDPNDPNLGYRYAEVWSLTFYLQCERREKLALYISLVAKRAAGELVTPEDELVQFETVFGPVDKRFERLWASFVLDQPFTTEFPDR